jgi:hypothetical protein
MTSKPGKLLTEIKSYGPISLLPIMAKISERLLLSRIEEEMPFNKLIPPYQFSFHENHSTAQQCHRIINKIRDSLEANKNVCFNFFMMYSRPLTRSGTKVYYTQKYKFHGP